MRRAPRFAVCPVLLAVMALGCSRRGGPDVPPQEALEAEFAGCAAVLGGGSSGGDDSEAARDAGAGPVCEIGESRVVRFLATDSFGQRRVRFEVGYRLAEVDLSTDCA
jgi:hypothetical protein